MYIFEISTFSLNLSHLDTYYLNDLSYTPSLTNWVVVALKSFTIFITFFLLADRIASVFGGAHLVPAASKSPLNLLLMVKIVTHDVNFSFLHKKECSFYTYLWCIEMRWICIYQFNCHFSLTVWDTFSVASRARTELTRSICEWIRFWTI